MTRTLTRRSRTCERVMINTQGELIPPLAAWRASATPRAAQRSLAAEAARRVDEDERAAAVARLAGVLRRPLARRAGQRLLAERRRVAVPAEGDQRQNGVEDRQLAHDHS